MRTTTLIAVGASLALLGVDASRFTKRDNPAVLKLDLLKKDPAVLSKAVRRRGNVETPDVNYNTQLLYIVQLMIGTPPQSTYVQLDTGSSDLVVETPLSDICAAVPPNPCTNFGSYVANASSTYQYIDSNFQVSYAGGDGATGDWGQDTVSIGGATLQNSQFGVMYKSTILEGILGVSYPIIEGRNTFSGEPIYDNLPILLVKQGYINSRAFSLWTNDDHASGGTLLFGGIDTSKFSGPLVTIDLAPSGFDNFDGVVDFTVHLNSITGTDASGNPVSLVGGSTVLNVLLDSGTIVTQLPQNIVTAIWAFAGATPNSDDPNSASIPCSAGSSTLKINLAFDGITISVPLSQLVIFPDSNNEVCYFGITISTFPIIGDTILAAMYVVYDLDNNQVSLAPTVFNSTAPENILEIMAGPNGVPDTSSSVGSSSFTSSSAAASSTVSSVVSTSSSSVVLSSTSSTQSSVSSTSSIIDSSTSSIISSITASSYSSTSSGSIIDDSSNTVSSTSRSSILSSSTSTLASTTSYPLGQICDLSSTLTSTSSSFSSTITSSSVLITSSTLVTSTTKPTSSTSSVKPLKCKSDNCLRAITGNAAIGFCAAYQAGVPIATPTGIAKGCSTLASRISSGCACVNPATVVPLSSTTTTAVLSSTTSRASVPTTTAIQGKNKCGMNNCLRAVQHAASTDFCSAYVTGAPTPVPTAIAKGCKSVASKVSSACSCLISSV